MDSKGFDIEKISPNILNISEERWVKYINMLIDAGYIKGIEAHYDINEELDVNINRLEITLKGLEYLSENTIMQRIYKMAKGISEIIP
jgi:DNA-binding Lrp family transcriptional regulator